MPEDILYDLIFEFANKKYKERELAYINKVQDGYECIIVNKCPLFDKPHLDHDLSYWKSYFKENNITETIGRFVKLSKKGNKLVFRKKIINLKKYLEE